MKILVFLVAIILCNISFAQEVVNLKDLEAAKEYDNILVDKINTDSNATSFVIWIKKGVKAHQHQFHTENLYVINGSGEMTIGDKTVTIKPGDYFSIPKGTFHSLKVTSKNAMKVLSVQAPEFYGKDRVFKPEN
jgi:mannose-6-phosphate isomerase-like protein (cupin superfamily)